MNKMNAGSKLRCLKAILLVAFVLIFSMLMAVAVSAASESEENDDISTADPISVNTYVSGSVEAKSDQDFFKFTLTGDGVVNLDFTHSYINSTTKYWNISILNSKLEEFVSCDVSGKEDDFSSPYVGLPAGTYYARVRCYFYGGATAKYDTTPYSLTVKFAASSLWEKEFNEDVATATPIQVNTEYKGALADISDQDIYKFTLTREGVTDLVFCHDYVNSTTNYWNVTVMDEREEVYASYNVTGKEDVFYFPSIGFPAGTYYVRIRCYFYGGATAKYDTIPYSFKVNFESSADWEKEFNEDLSTANPINVNHGYIGALMTDDDQDLYKFTLSAAGKVILSFGHEYINSDTNYWNVVIMDSRDEIFAEYNVNGKTDALSFPSVGLPAGTYYVRVRCYYYGGATEKHNAAQYTLNVNFEAFENWEKEWNSDISTATPINMYKLYNGVIVNSSDVDYYKFENVSANTIIFTFEHYMSSSIKNCYNIYLLDSRENVLASSKVNQSNEAITLRYENASAGIYYVKIAYYSNLCTEPYAITVSNPHTCYGSFKTTSPAGCLTSGWQIKRCSVCEALMEEKYVPALGHDFTYTTVDINEHNRHCERCGIDEKGYHEWSAPEITKPTSCKEAGEKTVSCTVCDQKLTEVIPMLTEHTFTEWTSVDGERHESVCECGEKDIRDHNWNAGDIIENPSHLKEGTLKQTCKDCGATKETFIPKTEVHTFGEWVKFDNNKHAKTCACGHTEYEDHIMVGTVTEEATCLKDGHKTEECQVCGHTETVVELAKGHRYSEDWTVDKKQDCVDPGEKSHHCMFCDARKDITAILPDGHDFDDWSEKTGADCLNAAVEHRLCKICSHPETRIGRDALGHNYETEWTVDVAPKCTEPGSKSHHCTRCGDKSDITPVAENGHSFDAWVVTKNAECLVKGEEERTCSVCKFSEKRDVIELGHNYETEWTVDTEPKCTEPGSKSHHCTRCGDKSDVTPIAENGHAFDAWVVTKNAECLVKGEEERTCSVCKFSEKRDVTELGHNYEIEWTVDTAPKCTEPGSKSHHCTRCGDKSDITPIAENGHTFEDWTVSQKASCEDNGKETKTCEICHTTEERDIVAEGHKYGTWVAPVEPTETKAGVLGHYQCSECQTYFDADKKEITSLEGEPALGPKEDNGCGGCGGFSTSIASVLALIALTGAAIIVKKK